jgi:subtilisin family serine protease
MMRRNERSSQRGVPARAGVRKRFIHAIVLISLVLMPLLSGLPAAPAPVSAQQAPSGDVIVVLSDRVIPAQLQQFISSLPVSVAFTNVFTGFAATLTQAQVNVLAQSDAVAGIFPDLPVTVSITDATGVRRIGAPSASTTGVQPAVNATVAVIDTGVQYDHPNLNVVGGFDAFDATSSETGLNCGALTPTQAGLYEDDPATTWGSSAIHPHGTHVAGIIGARGFDNVVGVAPGAGIVAVRALNEVGSGTFASVICGIDWVIGNRAEYGGIDAINMSIQSEANPGPCSNEPWHMAVCRASNDSGIPVIASVGNTTGSQPAAGAYDEVIAVSAFNDFDGAPGGLGTQRPSGCSTNQPSTSDDRFATYSLSDGADIMAPGTCIWSTWVGGGYAYSTGTSMAAPHVTGSVLLFKAANPGASPAQVRNWLNSVSVPQSDPAGLVVPGVSNGEPVLKIGAVPTVPTDKFAITQSFQSSGASSASVTYDGNMSTIWTSASGAPSSAFFALDLGEVKPIGAVRWVFGSGNGGLADSWQIQLSNDNTNWVTIKTRGNASPTNWQEQAINRNARYVRFFFNNPNRDARLGGIAEIEVLPADGSTTNLPAPTPTPVSTAPYSITNSGRSSGSASPLLAYDGNMSTVWVTTTSSVPSSAYIYFSLGSKKPIGTIRYVFGSGYGGLADSWQIQVSNDRVNWSTVANRGNASPGSWKEQVVNREATYVRFFFNNPNRDARLGGVAEVQILPATGSVASLPDATPTATATATTTATATATATPANAYRFSTAGRSSGSTAPSLVYDGDPATEWITTTSSTPLSAYIYVSIGGVKPIGEIRWVFATSGFADSYEIQLSNDRQTWSTIASRSNAAAGQWQTVTVNQEAHYVRFLFSNPNGTARLGGIGELQVYPQDSPSTASEGTVTASPTATATATEPAATETVVPTETATTPPTETSTAEPTTTEEPSPTETATEEPTIAPTETVTEEVTEEATVEAAAVETEVVTEAPVEETEAPWTPGPGLLVADWLVSEQSAEGWRVLDSDPLTDWRTWPGTALPEADLGFDLGQTTWVTELWWLVAVDAPGGRFIVETSIDGESWQVIGERATPGDPGTWTSMPIGVEARFVRFRFINDSGTDQLGGIAEVVFLP